MVASLASVDYSAAEAAYEKAAQLGASSETTIAQAFLQAFAPGGYQAAALATLAHLSTPEATVSAQNEAPDVALKWFQDTGIQLA